MSRRALRRAGTDVVFDTRAPARAPRLGTRRAPLRVRLDLLDAFAPSSL